MKLKSDDRIIAAGGVVGDAAVITVDAGGAAGIIPVTDIPVTGRDGIGTLLGGADPLAMAAVAPVADLLAEVEDDGKPAKAPVPFPLADDDLGRAVVKRVGASRW